MAGQTAERTGDQRRVYRTPPMVELCRGLAREHPSGPLFLNMRGNPWTRNAIRFRFRNLRQRLDLPEELVAYTFRHA